MANEFDRIMKENFREPSVALLNILFGLNIKKTVPLVTKIQHTIPEREADLLLKATNALGKSFIVHVEWQTTNDPNMCSRMLLYHALIYESYKLEVMGFVVYIGNKKMNMQNEIRHGKLSYSYEMIDPRLIEPDVFLESEQPEEVILAILASNGKYERREIIRKILVKLQSLLKNDKNSLDKRITQLEVLSLLRKEEKTVKEEENNMALSSIDFTRDIRYQEGIGIGEQLGILKGKLEDVKNMIKEGIELPVIQRITGLKMKQIQELEKEVLKK